MGQDEEIYVIMPNNKTAVMQKSDLSKYMEILDLLMDGVTETEKYSIQWAVQTLFSTINAFDYEVI